MRKPAEGLRGLYVLTDPHLLPDDKLADRVRLAIEGGAAAVQYRDKRPGDDGHLERARTLRAITRELGVLLIVNDNPGLAAAIDADGVHLGKDDPDPGRAREIAGHRIIGVSCYNDFDRARAAERAGADYVAFGSFYPTTTKSDTVVADPALLHRAKRELRLPVVAIGGITPENGRLLIESGADALAVVTAVFGADNPRAAAERFRAILKPAGDDQHNQ